MFPAAGDGCFYIGMGGKGGKPSGPVYEPYQCCPSRPSRGSKVAKLQPKIGRSKQVAAAPKPTPKPAPKKVEKTPPESRMKTVSKANHPTKFTKEKNLPAKQEKGKGKKGGLLGIGKYITWW